MLKKLKSNSKLLLFFIVFAVLVTAGACINTYEPLPARITAQAAAGDTAEDPIMIYDSTFFRTLFTATTAQGTATKGKFYALGQDIEIPADFMVDYKAQLFSTANNSFQGTLDGRDYKIKGMAGIYSYKATSTAQVYYTGLFPMLVNATVKNLVFEAPQIGGTVKVATNYSSSADLQRSFGVLAAHAYSATIENVHVVGGKLALTGQSVGVDGTGGLVGRLQTSGTGAASFTNCTSSIDIVISSPSVNDAVGGIVGDHSAANNNGTTVEYLKCSYNGNMEYFSQGSGTSAYIGGIVGGVGGVPANITQCFAGGSFAVTQTDNTKSGGMRYGGMVGYGMTMTISHCVVEVKTSVITSAQNGSSAYNSIIGGVVGHGATGVGISYTYVDLDIDVSNVKAQKGTNVRSTTSVAIAGVIAMLSGSSTTLSVSNVTVVSDSMKLSTPDKGVADYVIGYTLYSASSNGSLSWSNVRVNSDMEKENFMASSFYTGTQTPLATLKNKSSYAGWPSALWGWKGDDDNGYPYLLNTAVQEVLDYSALEAQIARFDGLDSNYYFPSDISALNTGAYSAAVLLAGNASSQEEIDSAAAALSLGIDVLPLNKSLLEANINSANALIAQPYYTSVFTEALRTALAGSFTTGEQEYASGTSTITTLKAATSALKAALDAMVPGKTGLNSLITQAQQLIASGYYLFYTQESKDALDPALTAALAEQAKSGSTAESIYAAMTALFSVLEGMTADDSLLAALVSDANDLKSQGNYVIYNEAQRLEFETALTDAQAILDKSDAAAQEIAAAYSALEGKMNALAADKSELLKLINKVKTEQSDENYEILYTMASRSALESALSAAETEHTSGTSDINSIYAAYSALKDAFDALDIDKAPLAALIEDAKAKEIERYTPESFAALEAAASRAETEYAKNDSTKQTYLAAYNELKNAIDGLTISKAILLGLLLQAAEVDSEYYTEQTYGDLSIAILAGQSVYDNSNDATEIIDAENALRTALEALALDKQILRDLISQADALTSVENYEIYFEAGRTTLESKLTLAKSEEANNGSTIESLKTAVEELRAAIAALRINKEALLTLITAAGGLENIKYTEASWNAFTQAFASANAVYSNDFVTVAEYISAYNALDMAIKGLALDKSVLQELIRDAESKAGGYYTLDSFEQLKNSLLSGKGVDADTEATGNQIISAEDALRDALDGLVPNSADGSINKLFLYTAITVAISKEEAKYTSLSFSKLKDSLTQAKIVFNYVLSSQTDVDTATADLNAKISLLIEKGSSDTNPGKDYTWLIVGLVGAILLLMIIIVVALLVIRGRRSRVVVDSGGKLLEADENAEIISRGKAPESDERGINYEQKQPAGENNKGSGAVKKVISADDDHLTDSTGTDSNDDDFAEKNMKENDESN